MSRRPSPGLSAAVLALGLVAAPGIHPARAGGDPPPPPPASSPRSDPLDLDRWLELLGCRDRATTDGRARCYVAAGRLRETAARALAGRGI